MSHAGSSSFLQPRHSQRERWMKLSLTNGAYVNQEVALNRQSSKLRLDAAAAYFLHAPAAAHVEQPLLEEQPEALSVPQSGPQPAIAASVNCLNLTRDS